MLAVLYYGSNPELVTLSWACVIDDKLRLNLIKRSDSLYMFEICSEYDSIYLSSRQMKRFIDKLGSEALEVDFVCDELYK